MTRPDPARVRALETAAESESRAIQGLLDHLRRAREAVETLDMEQLAATLGEARSSVAVLERRAAARQRLTREAGGSLGLGDAVDLADLSRALGPDGAVLADRATRLRGSLETLARTATALGLCTRQGQAVVRHLTNLAVGRGCYGPTGGPAPRAPNPGCRV